VKSHKNIPSGFIILVTDRQTNEQRRMHRLLGERNKNYAIITKLYNIIEDDKCQWKPCLCRRLRWIRWILAGEQLTRVVRGAAEFGTGLICVVDGIFVFLADVAALYVRRPRSDADLLVNAVNTRW